MSSRRSVRPRKPVREHVREHEAVAAGQHPAPAGFRRALLAKVPLPLRGLRPRLVVAFVLVAMASALSTGAVAFREARTGVLQQSQDSVIRQFRTSVEAAVVNLPPEPGQSHLQKAVNHVLHANQAPGRRVLATYGDLRASEPSGGFDKLSPELRRSVDTRRAAVFQRVDAGGHPYLVVGMPVTYRSGEGTGGGAEPGLSGVVMYLVAPQNTEQAYVEAMVSAIKHATLVALGLAVVLALLAASGVLRPVRALRGATRRMAEGTSTSGWTSTVPTSWPTCRCPSTTRRRPWSFRSRSCAAWRPGHVASSRTSPTSCGRRWRRCRRSPTCWTRTRCR